MNANQSAWDSFVTSGKIEDYLNYCQTRKQALYMMAGGEAEAANATENHGDYPAGYKN